MQFLRSTAKAVLPQALKNRIKMWQQKSTLNHDKYVRAAVSARKNKYLHQGVLKKTFSFITTVYDTPLEYLTFLADSLIHCEGFEHVEWVLLDNGSANREVIEYLENLSKIHSNIRRLRVENNLGIVGGMKKCLDTASYQYVCPLDSDDYVFPDTLKIASKFISDHGHPEALFSDEDKLSGQRHFDLYEKPGWDPILFYHSCYIAHLCFIHRETAIRINCYEAPSANGCHDWDTFQRLHLAGVHPVHIHENLYSWRVHPASTAGNIGSKDYIFASHKQTLTNFIKARGMEDKVYLKRSSLFNNTPDWSFDSRPEFRPKLIVFSSHEPQTPPISEVEFIKKTSPNWSLEEIRELDASFVYTTDRAVNKSELDRIYSSLSLFLLFPELTALTGRTIQKETIVQSHLDQQGQQPLLGVNAKDFGYFAQNLKPKSVPSVGFLNTIWQTDRLKKSQTIMQNKGFATTSTTAEMAFNPELEIRI